MHIPVWFSSFPKSIKNDVSFPALCLLIHCSYSILSEAKSKFLIVNAYVYNAFYSRWWQSAEIIE